MIQGYALGGGLVTALRADLRIASDDSQLGIPAVRLGLGYEFANTQLLVETVAPGSRLVAQEYDAPLFTPGQGCQLLLGDRLFGFLGEVGKSGRKPFELRGSTTVAELDLGVLIDAAVPIRRVTRLSPYPPVGRDLNLVVGQSAPSGWIPVGRDPAVEQRILASLQLAYSR